MPYVLCCCLFRFRDGIVKLTDVVGIVMPFYQLFFVFSRLFITILPNKQEIKRFPLFFEFLEKE